MSGSLQSAGGGQAGREALRRFLCHAGPVLVQKIEVACKSVQHFSCLLPGVGIIQILRRRDCSGSAA